ncbi:hypothetical protein ACFLR2_01885 [Chlamydiota bacterium]
MSAPNFTIIPTYTASPPVQADIPNHEGQPPAAVPVEALSDRERFIARHCELGILHPDGTMSSASEAKAPLSIDVPAELNFNDPLLQGFLNLLVTFFTKVEAKVKLTQGAFCALGWPILEKILTQRGIDTELITPDMRAACTKRPARFEFWVCLPEEHAGDVEYLQDFVVHFMFVQTLQEPLDMVKALKYQTQLEDSRMNFQARHTQITEEVGTVNPGLYRVIEFDRVRVILSFSPHVEPDIFQFDHVHAEIAADPSGKMILTVMEGSFQALVDQLIGRYELADPYRGLSSLPHALGSYCARLTHTGTFCLPFEQVFIPALTAGQLDLGAAFNAGLRALSSDPDALLTYHFNFVYFLNRYKVSRKPVLEGISPTTPMGIFLCSHDFYLLTAVLQVFGFLQIGIEGRVGSAPQCQVNGPFMQVSWSNVHLVFPYNFEGGLDYISQSLKADKLQTLNCIAQALELFTPSFIHSKPADRRLSEIYYAMSKVHLSTSPTLLRLFLLVRSQGELSETDADILPDQLYAAAGAHRLDSALGALKRVYTGSRFEPIFLEIEQEINALEERSPDQCRRYALTLLLSWGVATCWKIRALPPEFLLAVAPILKPEALVYALTRLCRVCNPQKTTLSPRERVILIATYYNRLVENRSQHLLSTSGPKLLELLEPILKALQPSESFSKEDRSILVSLLTHLTDHQAETSSSKAGVVCELSRLVNPAPSEIPSQSPPEGRDLPEDGPPDAGDLSPVGAPTPEPAAVKASKPAQTRKMATVTAAEPAAQPKPAAVKASEPTPTPKPAAVTRSEPGENSRLRDEIVKILGKKRVTFKDLHQVLPLLDKLPAKQWDLWERCFKSSPHMPSYQEILEDSTKIAIFTEGAEWAEKAWTVWLQKHPVEEFQPKDTKHWIAAVKNLLAWLRNTSSLFHDFLTSQALRFLETLPAEVCKEIAVICLERGVANTALSEEQNTTRLRASLAILTSSTVRDKIGDPGSLMRQELRNTLYLDFARQNDQELYAAGDKWICERIRASQSKSAIRSDENRLLFNAYVSNHYIPRDPSSQQILLDWIQKSWAKFKGQITWMNTGNLIHVLCDFKTPEVSVQTVQAGLQTAKPHHDFLLEMWAYLPKIPSQDSNASFYTEVTVKLLKTLQESSNRVHILDSLNFMYSNFPDTAVFVAPECRYLLKLVFCTHMFPHFLDQKNATVEAVKLTLQELFGCREYLKTRNCEECQNAVSAFIRSIPTLLSFSDIQVLQLVLLNIDKCMSIPWIVQADDASPYSWSSLLTQICRAVETAEPRRQKPVALTAMQIFRNCTQPAVYQRNTKLAPDDDTALKVFRDSSRSLLTFMLMPQSECLDLGDWELLISELPETDLIGMISDVVNRGTRKLAAAEDDYRCYIALARLIRHAGYNSPGSVNAARGACALVSQERYLHLDSLRLCTFLSSWIHGIDALILKSHRLGLEYSGALFDKQKEYVGALTEHVLARVQDDQTCDQYCAILTNAVYDELLVGCVLETFLKGRNASFHHNMVVVRLTRHLCTFQNAILKEFNSFCLFSTEPVFLNYDFEFKHKILIQWILAFSAIGKRCAERSLPVDPKITERKIKLTKELVQLVVEKFGAANYKEYSKLIMEALSSKDPEVAQAMLETLPDIPALALLRQIITRAQK